MPPVQIPRTDGGEKSSMKDIYKELFKEFDKKFVRDDGLMDKYTSDEDGDTIELAEGIKQFIRERTIPIKVSREGQAQVFWQICEALDVKVSGLPAFPKKDANMLAIALRRTVGRFTGNAG